MADRIESSAPETSSVIETRVDPTSARYEANMRFMADLVSQIHNEEETICEGGGQKAIENQHSKGRLTARERIKLLVDPGTFFELGAYSAHGMYEEWGGAPAAGVITGLARIHTRLVMIIANDATVKAGAFFPMTAKKVIRAQNIAIENHIPTIYLVDSAGVFLPLQEDVFPDTDDFGRVFRNNAVMSAMGISQIAAIMGMCVAGGGYLPVMCDHVLMTDGSGLFLAGPALVQAAIGQKISAEELGGAAMHAAISGTVDFRAASDEACLAEIRSIVEKWGYRRQSPWHRKKPVEPAMAAEEIYGIYDSSPARPYDMKEILARIVDGSRFDEYKPEYGKTVICGYARIGGFAVGIVANQKLHAQQTDHEGHKRIEFGGVIYTESAEKAARFIMDCNQSLVPLVFFHDVNGFMVGRDAEWSGIIKAGAKMVNAVANSVVPKITVIIGGSFGAGHYAMCGKAYDPRFVFAWPTARYAVMSGDSAAGTLVEIKIKQLERSGKKLSDEERKELFESVKKTYEEQTDPRYGAARLWIDKIIDPVGTRDAIVLALEAAALNPDVPEFKVGVLQT
ncbi:MAG: methylcrotonoyl-CoA carboxylase [Acidobacteria bacterium]|nr:MAG: methylcrotonoyl-CoA carboxylase [Acidobacteriales bacterium 13_2_20CM_2_55_5]PYX13941.1 MAG: methylcrotonoyl-CoA carboxylase [Acidobacteriota bacterium]